MKFLGYVKIIAVLVLFLTLPFANARDVEKSADSLVDKKSSSRQALLDAMEDPATRKAFHDVQLKYLQTKSDNAIHDYFSSNPVFRPLYNFLIEHSDKVLLDFERQAKLDMVQAVRGLTPKYDLLDKLVVDVAANLGFTKETIRNRQIFLLKGDENAFTVSGSQRKLIVAFQDRILQTMRRSEIAAVLAHELGHIRAEHPIKDIMNNIMLDITGELFVNGALKGSGSKISELNSSKIASMGLSNHKEQLKTDLDIKDQKEQFVDRRIQKFVESIADMDRSNLQYTMGSYLNMILKIARDQKAPMQTIRYFRTLLDNVGNIGSFKVNSQEYISHAKMIDFAVSRAAETSADQISASTVRNEYLASAFAKLLGLDFDKEFRPKIFEHIKKQAQEFLETVPAEQMPRYLTGTHPRPVLRINDMLTFPSYPSILFANNFLRLLLLHDTLATAEKNARDSLREFYENSKKVKTEVSIEIEKMKENGATAEEIKEALEVSEKQYSDLKQLHVEDYISLSKARVKQEGRVLSLLFSERFPVSNNRAPRMDNTIQYLSIEREFMYEAYDYLKSEIDRLVSDSKLSTEELKENTESIQRAQKNVLLALDRQKSFIDKIKKRLIFEFEKNQSKRARDNLRKRFKILSQIQEAESSLELERIRASVTTFDPNTRAETAYRRTRIPVKIHDKIIAAPNYSGSICGKLFAN